MNQLYSLKRLIAVSLLFCSVMVWGMAVENPLDQLADRVKKTYNITSRDQCMPTYSVKGLMKPSLLWETNSDRDLDIICLILGYKDLVMDYVLDDFLDPLIRPYVFDSSVPIRILKIKEKDGSSRYAYRNTPESEKNAYIFAKYKIYYDEANHFLTGRFLGYSEQDIEFYYASKGDYSPAQPFNYWPFQTLIQTLRKSFKQFADQNYPSVFLIFHGDVQRLSELIAENETSIKKSQESPEGSTPSDKEVLIPETELFKQVYKKIMENPTNHAPILNEILNNLREIKENYLSYRGNEWLKSSDYRNFLKDKIKALRYIGAHKKKTIEEIRKEIKKLGGTFVDELVSLKNMKQ